MPFLTSHHRVVVKDRAYVHGRAHVRRSGMEALLYKLEDTDVWTADVRSWGMSRYVDFPVQDMIGTRFGASDEGVYTARDQVGYAYIQTGMMNLVHQEEPIMVRKRINHIYTYATASAPLSISVSADYRGERTTQTYVQDYFRGSDGTRAARCTVGRGFASNYIQLVIAGAPFDLVSGEVEISPTRRRI